MVEVPKLKKQKNPMGVQWITEDDSYGIDWSPYGNILTILINPHKSAGDGGTMRSIENPLFKYAKDEKTAEFKAYMLMAPHLFDVLSDNEAEAAYQAVRDKFGMDEREEEAQ